MMGRRVVLHIGAMKTGTSYVQSVLGSNKDEIAATGVEFLGGFARQTKAVRDVLKLPQDERRNLRRWHKIARAAQQMEGHTGVVSMEFLSFAGPRHVEAFLAPLEGLDVRVLVTVRDQFRVLPAQWQTYTRNLGTDDWSAYLRAIEAPVPARKRPSRAHRTFHRAQDVATIVERWSVPAVSGIDVITVPPSSAPRDELWRRFARATGLEPDVADLEGVADNESLGYASCDWLRRANPHLDDLAPRTYRRLVRPLARGVLAPLRDEQDRPRLDARAAHWARERNQVLRGLVADGRVGLVGDLADLPVPDDLSGHPEQAPPPPAEHVLRCAQVVHDHAAARAGTPGSGPARDDVDALVRDAVVLLRRAQDTENLQEDRR
ncbi:hypothetical protein I601_0121 [Nocardioides dokdonensis FR1436]|uniref:Sulfotransferase family protein n=1 Tax=Nocardioides dokdonensis FR1436 TaxID=1300347 RepID=A0A1A9GGG6_9ACTN|nr:hypothetical protein [Nocardioides dokdonensis]ANH36575.1 hypothetical protein I601_0121 [Nocardioides dokdonensis FR1436]